MIAIATLDDWLRNLAPIFQPMRSKTKIIAPCTRASSRALWKRQVIAKDFDWFIALLAQVVIARSIYFDIVFSTVIRYPPYFLTQVIFSPDPTTIPEHTNVSKPNTSVPQNQTPI